MRRILFWVIPAVILLTSAIVVRQYNFRVGQILTAEMLNEEFNNLVTGVNNIDPANIRSSARFSPTAFGAIVASGSYLKRANPEDPITVSSRVFDTTPGASRNIVRSASAYTAAITTDTARTKIQELTITTTGGPIMVVMSPEDEGVAPNCFLFDDDVQGVTIEVEVGGVDVWYENYSHVADEVGLALAWNTIMSMVNVAAGAHVVEVYLTTSSNADPPTCDFTNVRLYAVEM